MPRAFEAFCYLRSSTQKELMIKALWILVIAVCSIVIIGFVSMSVMDVSPISFGMHNEIFQTDDLALNGYDPVAYLNPGKPLIGSTEFSATYNGAIWLFISDKHLKKFSQRPEFYMPRYGGHCAFAATNGFAAPGDGRFWLHEDNMLFFFSNADVMTEFQKDPKGMISKANENWK